MKKKLTKSSFRKFVMRVCFSLLVTLAVLGITYAHTGNAQDRLRARVTLKAENESLKTVLTRIEQTSGVRFTYTSSLVRNKRVSVNADERQLRQLLTDLLTPLRIGYTVTGEFVILERIADPGPNSRIDDESSSGGSIENLFDQSSERKIDRKIEGQVRDETGNGLPGVSVIVKDSRQGVITDSNGFFSLVIGDDNAELVFSFVGYETQEIRVGALSFLEINLKVDEKSLEEVVVVGYGTVKKRDLTGAVSTVKAQELQAFPTVNLSQALQGRVAGMHIQQNSGAPGSSFQIRIRGTNSIQGSNEPLWVIDGFPSSPSFLNAADVERIEVLKDASATAIYGSRGANGVILVTTKSGKAGKTRVDINSNVSFQAVRKKLDLLNATEYAQLYNEYWNNIQGTDYFSQDAIKSFGEGTDWQDQVFRTAIVQDHSVNVTGGNEKTQFSVGSSFLDQQGIIRNSYFQRILLRANVNHDLTSRIALSYNAIIGRTNSNPTADDQALIMAMVASSPTLKPYREDGSYQPINGVYPFSPDNIHNPVAYLNEISRLQVSNRVMANLALTLKPIRDLSVKFSANVSNVDSRSDNYTTTRFPTSAGSAGIGSSNDFYVNSNNIATYQKDFGSKHSLNVVAGFTYEQQTVKNVSVSGSGFLSDATETHNIGSATTINIPSSSFSQWTLLSWLGRVNYSFNDRILATVSFRADGSSRYSENNKWGYFPSAALAWRFIEEDFFKDVSFLSDGKIRVSYGATGSTAISPYYTLNMLSSGKVPLGTDLQNYFSPGTRFPADLRWETTLQNDIGLELGFFNNKLRLTADYYSKKTKDLLNSVQLPRSSGYATTVQNVGVISNKGLEFQVDANLINQGIKWNVGAVFSVNRNKVVKLYDGQEIRGSVMSLNVANDYINLLREGQPISRFYGYKLKGLDENGRYTFHDLDNDGTVNENDKTWIGNPNPNFIYGFNSTLNWKSFELNFFIQGTQGNDIFAASMINQNYKYYLGYNTMKGVLYDHWSPNNPNAKYPRIDRTFSTRMADNFVYDGSYLRLKTIRLAYDLPISKIIKNEKSRGQIYISGQNLLTITSYPWWDPDVNTNGGDNSINQGIDYYSYPVSKGVTVGFNLSF